MSLWGTVGQDKLGMQNHIYVIDCFKTVKSSLKQGFYLPGFVGFTTVAF